MLRVVGEVKAYGRPGVVLPVRGPPAAVAVVRPPWGRSWKGPVRGRGAVLRRPAATLEAGEGDGATLEAAEDDRDAFAIAGPALLGTLLDPFLSVIDTAWVSRLGTNALGAVAASSEIFTLTIAVSLALRESASSSIARLLAERRGKDAEAYARRTLQLAALGGLLLALGIGGPGAPFCVGVMGCPAGSPLHADALAYVRARCVALPRTASNEKGFAFVSPSSVRVSFFEASPGESGR